MKTRKKRAALKADKELLSIAQADRAKEILDRALIDAQFHLDVAEYNQLTDFEMKLYHTEACYILKQP